MFPRPAPDDAWITYRIAGHIATGRGFDYNPGEHVLVTTAPLYALVLAGLTRLGLETAWAGIALGAASAALGGALITLIGARAGLLAGGVAGLLVRVQLRLLWTGVPGHPRRWPGPLSVPSRSTSRGFRCVS